LIKTAGDNNCFTNATSTHDAGAWSQEIITGGDFELSWTCGPIGGASGGTFVGLESGSFTLTEGNWDFSILTQTENNTIDPHPPNSIFVYEGPPPNKAFRDGTWNEGDTLRIRVVSGVLSYYHKEELLYTSSISPTYPLRAIASIMCLNKTVIDAKICTGTAITDPGTGGGTGTSSQVLEFQIFDRPEDSLEVEVFS